MKFVEELPAKPPRFGSLLQRLADVLGCPVEVFDDPAPASLAQTSALLHLWERIETGEERAKVLAFIESMGMGG